MKSPIKWSGSKAPLAKEIISHFPSHKEQQGTFYELFCGSCAITLEMISGKYSDKRYSNYICVDNNEDLINLWLDIKTEPNLLADGYEYFWKYANEFQEQVLDNGIVITLEQHRKNAFRYVKGMFNARQYSYEMWKEVFPNRSEEELYSMADVTKNLHVYGLEKSIHFLYLLRCAFSGLVRYNSKGIYNSSCHFTRPGIAPDKLRKILNDTSELLHEYNVEFHCSDYKNIISTNENDFVFMDPPYSSIGNGAGKKSMYHGGIDTNELIEYCNGLKCGYALTFDGDRGEDKANRISLNETKIVNLKKKNSSYSRMNGKQVDVEEIMYIKI